MTSSRSTVDLLASEGSAPGRCWRRFFLKAYFCGQCRVAEKVIQQAVVQDDDRKDERQDPRCTRRMLFGLARNRRDETKMFLATLRCCDRRECQACSRENVFPRRADAQKSRPDVSCTWLSGMFLRRLAKIGRCDEVDSNPRRRRKLYLCTLDHPVTEG